ncbi:MAG: hypothetical protein ABR927_02370 [Bacteroidales bacterium]|jgi:hypothetical protein
MKKPKRMFLISIACSTIVLMLSVSFQAQHAKITGTWNMTVETSAGSGTPVFVLKQENDTLIIGTYKGQFGEATVNGTIKVNKINLKFSASDLAMEYTGTVDGNSMKGKVVFGTMGEGTFTGTRKEN